MTLSRVIACLALVTVLAVGTWSEVSRNTLDEFTSIAQHDWTSGADPLYLGDGGPNGVGDAWLQIQSNGSFGAPGGSLAVYCSGSRWTGNYKKKGVGAISLWLRSFSNLPLSIRVVLHSTGSHQYGSIQTANLAPNQGWTNFKIRIGKDEMVKLRGSKTFDQVYTNVTRIMLRHDPDPPTDGGTPVVARLGIDKVGATSRPVNNQDDIRIDP